MTRYTPPFVAILFLVVLVATLTTAARQSGIAARRVGAAGRISG